MRHSLMPFSVLNCFMLTVNLPMGLPQYVVDFVSRKHTMIVSNLHATKKRLNFNGHEQLGCFYFVPCPGVLSTGVSFCVCGDLMGVSVFADQINIKNP